MHLFFSIDSNQKFKILSAVSPDKSKIGFWIMTANFHSILNACACKVSAVASITNNT